MPSGPVYAFGGFQLDTGGRRLVLGSEPVALSDRHIDILLLLVAHHGQIVSKNDLIDAAWKDVAVGDNSLEQAISSLRRKLGTAPDGSPYIETVARRGYRFVAPVARSVPRQSDEDLEALLAPYRMFVEGRAAAETLTLEAVSRARQVFVDAVSASPDYAPALLGLANTLTLEFEATRSDPDPAVDALLEAIDRAREACRLAPGDGAAWGTLTFVLSRAGANAEAVAAGYRAIALEPDNWRHFIRLGYAAWGEERLRAVHQAERLMPGLALSHWLAATVHVARQAFDEAARELTAGTAAQDQQQDGGPFGAVGLHLLRGLVRLAVGDEPAAERELERELSFEPAGHIHTRQACANAWLAVAALHLRHGRTRDAVSACESVLVRVPGHPLALAALSVVAGESRRASFARRLEDRIARLAAFGASTEAAMTRAVVESLSGRIGSAASLVQSALESAPAGTAAGWTLPVEPLLQVTTHPAEWAAALATLRQRAA